MQIEETIEDVLQKAADAMGIIYIGRDSFHDNEHCAYNPCFDINYVWNPLESDTDAYHLMLLAGISIRVDFDACRVYATIPDGDVFESRFVRDGDNLSDTQFNAIDATRPLIVYAACRIWDKKYPDS